MRYGHPLKCIALLLIAFAPARPGSIDTLGDVDDFLISALPLDGIPAVTNPLFMDADEATYSGEVDPGTAAYLADGNIVLGVYHNGVAKAYPLNLGWWHEVINDRIGDQFISVTYCPLTGSGLVFDVTDTDGSQLELGVSGWLLNSNLMMYDRRNEHTLFPQMTFTGVWGPFRDEQLKLLPVIETTWGLWKKMYPDTRVPRPATGLERYSARRRQNYEEDPSRYYDSQGSYPYDTYRTDSDIYFALFTHEPDLSLYHPKDMVLGICQEGLNKAYPFRDLPAAAVINDQLGSLPLLVLFHAESRTAIPYRREVEGQLLTFYAVETNGDLPVEFEDVETRSRWNMLGEAVVGPMKGHQLEQVPAYNAMWFAWNAYWPNSAIWSGEGILDEVPSTAVEEEDSISLPEQFALQQNFPNPFNPRTLIRYSLPQEGQVHLHIYNAAGQHIRTLVEAHQQAGFYLQNWDGRDHVGTRVGSGTYLYRLDMPEAGISQTRRMTLMR